MEQREGRFILVRQADLQARAMRGHAASEVQARLMQHPEVQTVLRQFEVLLNEHRSVAAIHRLLQSERLTHQNIGPFRKRWTGAASWIRSYVWPGQLLTVYRLTGAATTALTGLLAELEAAEHNVGGPAPQAGEPVYVLRS